MFHRFASLASVVALAATVLVAPACSSLPKPKGSSVESRSSADLDQKSPVDVAIAPVIDKSGAAAPGMALRTAFAQGLIKRRYSPLSLTMVDKQVVDASYRAGALDEQAVLQLTVERWGTSMWMTHGVLDVALDARLIDSAGGGVLWSGRIDRKFELGAVADLYPSESARNEQAAQRIASEVLGALPARNPAPGYLQNGG